MSSIIIFTSKVGVVSLVVRLGIDNYIGSSEIFWITDPMNSFLCLCIRASRGRGGIKTLGPSA